MTEDESVIMSDVRDPEAVAGLLGAGAGARFCFNLLCQREYPCPCLRIF